MLEVVLLSTVLHCFSFLWELSSMSINIDYPESKHFLTAYITTLVQGPSSVSWIIALSFFCPWSLTVYFYSSSQHDPIKHMADQVTSLLKTFWGALICLRVRAMVFTIMVHTILWPGPLLARWLPLLSPPPTPLQPCSLGHVSLFATPLPLLLILTWFASLFPSSLSLNFHALVRVSVTILLKL